MSQLETSCAEAARWDARLRACDCSDAERDAFAAWRSRPENDAAYARLQAALTLLCSQGSDAEMIKPRREWGLRRVSIGLAASFAAALLVGGWLATRPAPDMIVSAPAAVGRSIRFADGSAMLLAPGSTMKLHYAGDARRATLISGSARLMLASDQRHPFILYAADRRVVSGSP